MTLDKYFNLSERQLFPLWEKGVHVASVTFHLSRAVTDARVLSKSLQDEAVSSFLAFPFNASMKRVRIFSLQFFSLPSDGNDKIKERQRMGESRCSPEDNLSNTHTHIHTRSGSHTQPYDTHSSP